MREAFGEFFVLCDNGFVCGGVAEGLVEGCGERSAGEHFSHEVLADVGEVVLDYAVDVLPDVAGFYAACLVAACFIVHSARKIHAEYGEEFWPVDGGVFGVLGGACQQFREFRGVEVLQKFAVFLHGRRDFCWHGFRGV